MSTRLSFYEIKGLEKVGLGKVIDAISSNQFTDESQSGFLIDRRSSRSVESRFVEKFEVVDSYVDPFGNSHTQSRIQYTELKFQLRIKRPQLVIFNANPTFKAFTGRLLEYADFRISIAPLTISPTTVVEQVESEFESVVVYMANPLPVNLTPAVIVRFAFEGSEDVRKHANSFLKNRNPKYKTLKFQFWTASATVKCEVKESGTLLLYGECDPIVVEKIMSIMDEILSVD